MTAEPEPKLLTRVRADLILAVATAAVFARGLGHGLMTSWDDQRFLVDFEPIQTVNLANALRIAYDVHGQARCCAVSHHLLE